MSPRQRPSRNVTAPLPHHERASCNQSAAPRARLAAGAPLHQVQRHLRHKEIQTTLRYDREREAKNNPTTGILPAV